MWVAELVLSIIVAALFVGLLILILKPGKEEKKGITAIVFLFLALFLPIWAGGIWLGPMGPAVFGMYFLPFLLIGLGVALLLAAVAPLRKSPASDQMSYETGPEYTFGPFFLAFVITFLLVIFLGYFFA
jgi:hypothetical protein